MPAKSTVLRWVAHQKEFRDQYARAREDQADALAEEIIAIADDGARDVVVDDKGNKRVDWENVHRARLRVDARKWFAGKVAPKRYGERVAQELSGPDGGPIETVDFSGPAMPPAEVAAAVAKLIKREHERLGLPPPKGGTGVRVLMQQILASGHALPPGLYAAVFADRRKGAADRGADVVARTKASKNGDRRGK